MLHPMICAVCNVCLLFKSSVWLHWALCPSDWWGALHYLLANHGATSSSSVVIGGAHSATSGPITALLHGDWWGALNHVWTNHSSTHLLYSWAVVQLLCLSLLSMSRPWTCCLFLSVRPYDEGKRGKTGVGYIAHMCHLMYFVNSVVQ